MSVERVIYCDNPTCRDDQTPTHARTLEAEPHIPEGFLTVHEANSRTNNHFCSWDCLLTFAGRLPPKERFDPRSTAC